MFIDGLPKSLVPEVGTALRRLRIKTEKVRGIRKEEANALMRLADAICGFTRAAQTERPEWLPLLKKAQAEGYIREL